MKHTIFNLKGKIYLNLFKRIEILYSIQDISDVIKMIHIYITKFINSFYKI